MQLFITNSSDAGIQGQAREIDRVGLDSVVDEVLSVGPPWSGPDRAEAPQRWKVRQA
jgi:hypothetical protein